MISFAGNTERQKDGKSGSQEVRKSDSDISTSMTFLLRLSDLISFCHTALEILPNLKLGFAKGGTKIQTSWHNYTIASPVRN